MSQVDLPKLLNVIDDYVMIKKSFEFPKYTPGSDLDLLIIDEAHYLRNPESMTSKLGKLLQPVAEHLVLLSATPIHLKSRDLFQLLNLIDEDTFDRPEFFDKILLANKPLIEARDKLLRNKANSDEIISLLMEGNRQLKQL